MGLLGFGCLGCDGCKRGRCPGETFAGVSVTSLAPDCKPGASVCGLCGGGRVGVGSVMWDRVLVGNRCLMEFGKMSKSCRSWRVSTLLGAGGDCGGGMFEWSLGGGDCGGGMFECSLGVPSSEKSESPSEVGVVGLVGGPGSIGVLRVSGR